MELIGFGGPISLRVGGEIPVSHSFSVLGVYGIYLRGDGNYIKAGFKKYRNSTKQRDDIFIGITGFYKEQNYWRHDVLSPGGPPNPLPGAPTVSYNVNKRVWGIHLEAGLVEYWRHFVLEGYGGVGFRFRDVQCNISDSLLGKLYHVQEGMDARFIDPTAYHNVRLSFTGGVRIGYYFRTKSEMKKPKSFD